MTSYIDTVPIHIYFDCDSWDSTGCAGICLYVSGVVREREVGRESRLYIPMAVVPVRTTCMKQLLVFHSLGERIHLFADKYILR